LGARLGAYFAGYSTPLRADADEFEPTARELNEWVKSVGPIARGNDRGSITRDSSDHACKPMYDGR
jgi:hypothetical protein